MLGMTARVDLHLQYRLHLLQCRLLSSLLQRRAPAPPCRLSTRTCRYRYTQGGVGAVTEAVADMASKGWADTGFIGILMQTVFAGGQACLLSPWGELGVTVSRCTRQCGVSDVLAAALILVCVHDMGHSTETHQRLPVASAAPQTAAAVRCVPLPGLPLLHRPCSTCKQLSAEPLHQPELRMAERMHSRRQAACRLE
jgi:hypothetical protein